MLSPLSSSFNSFAYYLIRHGRAKIFCIRYDVPTAMAMKSPIFWKITPCGPLKVKVDLQQTTRHYISEDRTLQIFYI
jgi:hypothetical protein